MEVSLVKGNARVNCQHNVRMVHEGGNVTSTEIWSLEMNTSGKWVQVELCLLSY